MESYGGLINTYNSPSDLIYAGGALTATLSTRPDGATEARTLTSPFTSVSSRTSARW